MTFDSIDRALDYLSGQNPGKVAIVVPVKKGGNLIGYQLQFHDPDEVMIRAIPRAPARVIHLKKVHSSNLKEVMDDVWDLKIT